VHNEELHNLYSLPNISRMIKSRSMKWSGHVACIREECRILVGESDEKRPLGRCRHRWEDNIVMC
jgi:hypothetical protein